MNSEHSKHKTAQESQFIQTCVQRLPDVQAIVLFGYWSTDYQKLNEEWADILREFCASKRAVNV